MRRREFLKIAGGLLAVPSLPLRSVDWTLRCETFTVADDFAPYRYRVIKGPYEVNSNYALGQELMDCNGLCATEEWASIVRDELEYGPGGMLKLLSLSIDCSPEERLRLKKELKRVEVTEEEFWRMIGFFDKLRGPHDCVLMRNKNA